MHYYIEIAVFLILVVSFVIAYMASKRNRDIISFLFEGNNWKWGASSNIGSIFSVTIFVGIFGSAYMAGSISLLWFLILIVAGFGTVLWFLRQDKLQKFFEQKEGRKTNRFSIIEYVGQEYGSKTELAIIPFYIYFILLSLALELAIFQAILNHILPDAPIGSEVLTLFIVLICYMYVSIGGFRGILWTDIFQLAIVSCVVLLFVIGGIQATLSSGGVVNFGVDVAIKAWGPISLKTILCFIFFGLGGVIMWYPSSADFWIRTAGTIKGVSNVKRAIWVSFAVLLILILILVFFALWARANFGWTDYGEAFYYPLRVIDHFINGGLGIFGLVCLVVFASVIFLTTANTLLVTLAQLFYIFLKNIKAHKSSDVESNLYKFLSNVEVKWLLGIFLLLWVIHFAFISEANYGEWGTAWISLYLIVMPVILNAFLGNKIKVKDGDGWKGLILGYIIAISIVIFFLKRDPHFLKTIPPEIPIGYLFSVPMGYCLVLLFNKIFRKKTIKVDNNGEEE